MRFLTDAGISPRTMEFLSQLGHDVVHVRMLDMHRSPDQDIITRALADARIVITFDLDFGDILALGVLDGPGVIILRLADERSEAMNSRLARVLEERSVELGAGMLILVEDTRYRVRRLPISPA